MKQWRWGAVGLAMVSVAALVLAGCASGTRTREVSVGYAIFDIQGAGLPRGSGQPSGQVGGQSGGQPVTIARVAEAVKVALQKQMPDVQIVNGVPPSPLPAKAPRFNLVSPFRGTGLGALAAASGQSLQVPNCEGAVLVATSRNDSLARYGEGTTFFACVMPYEGGLALNVYTTFQKASGAFNAAVLGATLARTVVGDSSQFIPRTIEEVVEGVRATGARVTLVEAYP